MIGPRHHGPGRTLVFLTVLALGLAVSPAAEAALTYTVSTELKKASCSGDTDSDCLDNVEEGNLAWAVAPWYFYDEDEDCSGWRNSFGLPAFHFARQDFFQVRPEGPSIQGWSPTDGQAKWVKVTYFFNFPHDCRSTVGFGGHQGDSEHIKVQLYSYDLKTWYLYQAYYAHHDRDHWFSGTYLEDRARSLGTNWISVTADEDSHGSWPGLSADSTHCAGSEDDFCASTCDCFVGTWRNALSTGAGREVVGVSRNIGGPWPETWNASVLTVSGSEAYTQLDVGHGLNREYWTPRSDSFQKFCGWECPTASRRADGTCSLSVHDRTGCSSQLSTKVDTTSFSLATAGSCAGACGGSAGSCFCDASCVNFGDCCADACAVCGVCGASLASAQSLAAGTESLAVDRVDPAASRAAASAVEGALPQLRGASAAQQLRTLRWMLASGEDRRLVFLFDDLREARGEPLERRAATARQRLEELAVDLEKAGHSVSEPAEEAARVDPNAPPPNTFPPGVLEALGLNRDGSLETSAETSARTSRPAGR